MGLTGEFVCTSTENTRSATLDCTYGIEREGQAFHVALIRTLMEAVSFALERLARGIDVVCCDGDVSESSGLLVAWVRAPT